MFDYFIDVLFELEVVGCYKDRLMDCVMFMLYVNFWLFKDWDNLNVII